VTRVPKALQGLSNVVSDAELLARLQAGEMSALGELYDRHQFAVRRFLVRATSNAHDVDDLVHTAFLTLAKTAPRYDGRATCRPWLLGIAVQLLKRRRYALGRWLGVLAALREVRAKSKEPEAALYERSALERALSQLSEAKRTTLLLAELEELSGPEIAALLEIPLGTVWTRLHAARRELRALLENPEA
jgi:RNA polymerase sigma factor (sigma-70 family)